MTRAVSNSPCDTTSDAPGQAAGATPLWTHCPGLPAHARAVLAALHLTAPDFAGLAALSPKEWRAALEFAHQNTVGLDLRKAAAHSLPAWVREELDACSARNAGRMRRLRELYAEMRARLDQRGIPFVALKGLTHAPLFGSDAEDRQQCDIDLYVPRERAFEARDMLREWGYEEWEGTEGLPTDHLPAMLRKTGWVWRGDYFDMEAPFAVEVHFQFWNEKLERLPAPGVESFWDRREVRACGGLELPALAPADALAYASLHLVKHLFQGSARASHVLEIARFLHARAADDAFWSEWQALHSPELRRLQAVAFRLAECWFGCDLSEAARAQIAALPEAVLDWFRQFAASPVTQKFRPNKDELWLQLALIDSVADAWSVARRRLLPLRIPGPVTGIFTPASEMTLSARIAKQADRAVYIAGRARRHAVTLPRSIVTGVRWWFGSQFWWFLAAGALFNLALFIFTLLYNLFLMDSGYREDFMGTLSGSSTLATMAGALPAAWVLRRFGLRRTLLGMIAASACIVALRTLAPSPGWITTFACAWGFVFAGWAVIIAPAIAAAVPEKRRPAAFSVFFASMISLGVVGNWVAGYLPLLMHGKKPALLLSAVLAGAAILPAWRWRPGRVAAPDQPGRIWPRGPFMKRYLAAYAVWHLATGAFNPFHNVYFARLGYSAARIGSIFSLTQITQVGTLLLAPALIRRAGLVPAIVCMMAGAGLGLFGLTAGTGAVFAYAWYATLQWASEPGLNTLLMNRVHETERNGASSLNYVIAFGAQAIAAFAAGRLFTHFGYAPVLSAAGGLALVASIMFRYLVGR